jgi:hypothetical protein
LARNKQLSQIGEDWAHLIQLVGPCTHQPKPGREPYDALIRAVAFQQLHARAADAIFDQYTPKTSFNLGSEPRIRTGNMSPRGFGGMTCPDHVTAMMNRIFQALGTGLPRFYNQPDEIFVMCGTGHKSREKIIKMPPYH